MLHILMQILQLPPNIVDLAPWLILPAFLGLAAPFIISTFFPGVNPLWQVRIKFAVYILIGLLSYGLGLIPPDVLAKFQPLYAILAATIAAFLANEAILKAVQLVGVRLLLGREAFLLYAKAEQEAWRAALIKRTLRPAG